MRARTRKRHTTRTVINTTVDYLGNVGTASVTANVRIDQCNDFFRKKKRSDGLLPPSNATISKRHYKLGFTTSSWPVQPSYIPRFQTKMSSSCQMNFAPNCANLLISKDKGDKEYLSRLLQRSNPTRPYFSVFVFIRELLEVLTLFSIPARSLGQLAGGTYLNAKFGWDTFVSDLESVDKIVKQVASRVRELRSIKANGGIRRSIPLDKFSATFSRKNVTLSSGVGYVINGDSGCIGVRTVRGSVRWQAHPLYLEELDILEPFEEWDRAMRYVLSLNSPTLTDVWNIIPFSWLVDYFYDLNGYFIATQNEKVFWPVEASIIRETKYVTSHSIRTSLGWVSCDPGSCTESVYDRKIVDHTKVSPTVSFLPSLGQLTTLTALLLRLRPA